MVRKGGAEKVALTFHFVFPKAPIYTLAYHADKTYPEFNEQMLGLLGFKLLLKKNKSYLFLLGIFAMKALKLLSKRRINISVIPDIAPIEVIAS